MVRSKLSIHSRLVLSYRHYSSVEQVVKPLMRNAQSGFTLVELITVMALIGILSAVAFSRFGDPSIYRQALFVDQLQSSLRFTQQLAMARQTQVSGASLPSAAQFSLINTDQHQWHVVINNGADTQQYSFKNNVEVRVDQQLLNSGEQLDINFDANGNIISRSFPVAADSSLCTALQIGDQALCIAPTGFSYEGLCI